MIYDIPDFTGTKLDKELINTLAHHENVIGFKDSSSDMERFKSLLDAIADVDEFYVLQGKEALLAESIANGASGIVISLLHINPIPFVKVYEYAKAHEMIKAERILSNITQVYKLVMGCFSQRHEFSTLMHILNYCLKKHSITQIALGSTGDVEVWAKWAPALYAITYNLDGSTNNANNPAEYNIESSLILFGEPSRGGYLFEGWYISDAFTAGSGITEIPAGSLLLDFWCDFTNMDQAAHQIVYGHNMKNGSMFQALTHYEDESFFSDNSISALIHYTETIHLRYFLPTRHLSILTSLRQSLGTGKNGCVYSDAARQEPV